jgi:hypothetical protein
LPAWAILYIEERSFVAKNAPLDDGQGRFWGRAWSYSDASRDMTIGAQRRISLRLPAWAVLYIEERSFVAKNAPLDDGQRRIRRVMPVRLAASF